MTFNGIAVSFSNMPLDSADDVLSTAEAAQVIGVSVPQLRRLRGRGALPYIKVPGGHPRYRRSVVEAYARSLTVDAQNEAAS